MRRPRPTERLTQAGEHRQVGVEPHPFQASDPKRREPVIVLQTPELPLDSRASTVQLAEPLTVAANLGEQTPAKRERQDWLLSFGAAKRDNRVAATRFALGIDAGVVVALVSRDGLGFEAASDEASRSGAMKLDS
jgi:hypothetical protein